MDIIADQLGKRYNREWVFKSFSKEFSTGSKIAITGSNGSGKSTLLKILSNYLSPSEGTINYRAKDQSLEQENIQLKFALVAPYANIVTEFTVYEMIAFHKKFKKSVHSVQEIAELALLSNAGSKSIQELSSGMLQRLKLSLSLFFETEILFLDEPTTNLDAAGVAWYLKNIKNLQAHQTVIIASNQKREYTFCEQTIDIEKFKK